MAKMTIAAGDDVQGVQACQGEINGGVGVVPRAVILHGLDFARRDFNFLRLMFQRRVHQRGFVFGVQPSSVTMSVGLRPWAIAVHNDRLRERSDRQRRLVRDCKWPSTMVPSLRMTV